MDPRNDGEDERRGSGSTANVRNVDELFGEDREKRVFVFYGLKHTFITALERAGIDRTLRERICGHTPDDINSAVYSAGAGIEQMRKAVQKVTSAYGSSPSRTAMS